MAWLLILKVLLLAVAFWIGGNTREQMFFHLEATIQELQLNRGYQLYKSLCYMCYGVLLVYYPIIFYTIWIL